MERIKLSDELRQILENAAVVLIIVDIEGEVKYINKTGIQMLSKFEDDILGHLAGDALNCINSHYQGDVVCGKGKNCCNCLIRSAFSNTFETGDTHYQEQGEFEINLNEEIKRLNLLVSTSLISVNDGKYVLITIDDITREKEYQIELKNTLNKYQEQSEKLSQTLDKLNDTNSKLIESETYVKTILDTEPECVKVLDFEGKVIYINPAGLDMIQADNTEQVKGKKIVDFILDKYKQTFSELHNSTLNGEKGKLEFEIKGLKGRRIWLETNSVPLYNNEKIIGSLSITRNITDYKNSEKALKASETQLKELNATKDIFFSIIAHDLRNPFNIINGFSEILIENQSVYSNEEKEQYYKIISESSQKAQELLENLLEWSKLQTGNISINPEIHNIESVIQSSIEQIKSLATKKNIQINYSQQEKFIASVDKLIINTILRNLLTNAIKFTPQFGNITINSIKDDNNIIISVQDTGVGIKPYVIKKLFKISEKHSSLGTEQEKGSGLGLILCKEFITIHGGKIWVESEEGKGSCLSFSIPIQHINSI